MNGRTLILVAVALLSGAISPIHADENVAAPKAGAPPLLLEKYRETLKSIDAEKANAVAIFENEVKAGKEQDGWRADVKEAALQWVHENPATQPPQILPEDMAARRSAAAASMQRMKDFRKRPKLAPPASVPAAQLIQRIDTLQERRDEALLHYAGDLTAFAEDLWIKAEKPADLRPVAAAFAELNALAPGYLAQTNGAGPMNRPPAADASPSMVRQFAALQAPRRVEAFYAALFTAADEPLLFPDPKTDAEGYTKMRVKWIALLRTNTPFLTRPRVAARVAQLDARYEAQRVAAGEQLNALIVENAPAAACEPALNHFSIFKESFDSNFPVLRPQFPQGMPPMAMGMQPMAMVFTDTEGQSVTQWMFPLGPLLHDYRDLFGLRPGSPPRPMMGAPPWPVQEAQIMGGLSRSSNAGIHMAYRQWLDYRSAEERGAGPAEMANLWEELRQGMSFLPSVAQDAIRKRRGSPAAPQVAASLASSAAPAPHPVSPKKQAVAELIAALEEAVSRLQSERAAGGQNDSAAQIAALLEQWRKIDHEAAEASPAAPSREEPPLSFDGATAWNGLAERPDCAHLFDLREKAVRYALGQILSSHGDAAEKSVPLRKVIETALEQSALTDDWARVHRILRLDGGANLLSEPARQAWTQMAAAFQQAAREAGSSPDAARAQYLGILQVSENPAITSLAIRHLKALRGNETPP